MEEQETILQESKLLLDFLLEESNGGILPQQLWLKLEKSFGQNIFSEIIYSLTRMSFPPDEARVHWEQILAHRQELTKKLGRDPGLRVSLADYFVNLQQSVKNPIIVEINLFLKKEETALKDELTGLFNRRFFNQMLAQEIDRARRFGEPVSVLMLDVDYFKRFNDTQGHPQGDQILAELAVVFRNTSRSIDHLTRYGGEEFAFILPRADRSEALIAALRHCRAVEERRFLGPKAHRLTVSIGAATYPLDARDGKELVQKADLALYKAKNAGRNGAVSFNEDKRRFARVPMEFEIKFRPSRENKVLFEGQAKNISYGGLLGKSNVKAVQGETFEFQIPARRPGEDLWIKGECVRILKDASAHDAYYMGIKFIFEGPGQQEALRRIVEGRARG
ncbi:MAG: diguanylate cyclase [Pseudomonadota bacterium]